MKQRTLNELNKVLEQLRLAEDKLRLVELIFKIESLYHEYGVFDLPDPRKWKSVFERSIQAIRKSNATKIENSKTLSGIKPDLIDSVTWLNRHFELFS